MTYQEVGELSIRFIKVHHAELHEYFEGFAHWRTSPRDQELVKALHGMGAVLYDRFGNVSLTQIDYKEAEELLGLEPIAVPKVFEEAFKEGELDL